ncbi:hypothetical protein FHR24_000238 [Wenyingzhuangia heitensis]|uniref:S1/P1 Nuclease n=1 Tax=Wenyingzhuangia heitensis TaxID=1487859 RepID=A0ABX0U4M5_9FLAO|nr:S1/P1 nuclease [Wenyingzhuangia heitensis]NIJ43799.1 hypothetical protein [Wenyingzhuangia heitensis]
MIKYILILCTSISLFANNDWGKTGHRTVGEIAAKHISKNTEKQVNKLLQGESLAMVSIYADEIRSNPEYNSFAPWHYVSFNGDKKYKEEPVNPKGDILQGIKTCILKIRDKNTSTKDKAFYLKMLVHFVGDLHMPLHAGNKHDKGGNDIKLKWFGNHTNLHRLWDTDMIESYKMSYSELASNLDIVPAKENQKITKGTLTDWAHETRAIALKVYESTEEDKNESYVYMYHNFPIVKQQLQKGGVRLAMVLDEVFKKESAWLISFLKNI